MLVEALMFGAAIASLLAASRKNSGEVGEASHQLLVEDSDGHPTPADHLTPHDVVDAVLKSKPVSAMNEAATRVTTTIGGIVNDVGDFVVTSVKDLPDTLREVSGRVGQAVTDGSQRVVIVVKGVRTGVRNMTASAPQTLTDTKDKVFKAASSSKMATSLQHLHHRTSKSAVRIFDSFKTSSKDVDEAVADGISEVSGESQQIDPADLTSSLPSKVNEIQDVL